jgi:hypothetical protein
MNELYCTSILEKCRHQFILNMKHSKFYHKSSQKLATNWLLENSQDRDGCL